MKTSWESQQLQLCLIEPDRQYTKSCNLLSPFCILDNLHIMYNSSSQHPCSIIINFTEKKTSSEKLRNCNWPQITKMCQNQDSKLQIFYCATKQLLIETL